MSEQRVEGQGPGEGPWQVEGLMHAGAIDLSKPAEV